MLRTEWRWNAEREPVPLLQGSDLRLSLTLGMDLSCAFNKKDVWHSATMLKTQPPVEGSPLYSPAYLSTRHSHASVSETFAFAPDIFTHVSISWIQYPVWNCERDWGFFFDVLHFVCLFILGCAGSWVLHTSVRPDAACGLLALVGSHAVERSREGEGFRLSAHQLRCCTARGILQDQGSVSCPLLRQVASYPLCPQGSLM